MESPRVPALDERWESITCNPSPNVPWGDQPCWLLCGFGLQAVPVLVAQGSRCQERVGTKASAGYPSPLQLW